MGDGGLVGGKIGGLDAEEAARFVERAQVHMLWSAGRRALQMKGQPVDAGIGRPQHRGQQVRRIGHHGQAPQPLQALGQARSGIAIGAGQSIAEPEDIDIAIDARAEVQAVDRLKRGAAVAGPGQGLEGPDLLAGRRGAHGAASGNRATVGRRRRGHQDDRNREALGLIHGDIHAALARWPAGRGCPAVIHDEHQGLAPGELALGVHQRLGKAEDDEAGQQQAQQNQPEGRAMGRFLGRHQIEEQADGRKTLPAGRRRRQAQQPPQDRQACQRQQQPGREEGEAAQDHEGLTCRSRRSVDRGRAALLRPAASCC